MEKKLYRIRRDRQLAGVCGGVAEYFGMDPSIVRVIWLVAGICTGIGFIAYVVAACVIPEKPDDYVEIK